LRRGLLPAWARPALIVRDEHILMPMEIESIREGDYVYLLAPPEKAQALDRFFVDMPPPSRPDPRLLGDFFVTGEHTLGELAKIYGLAIAPEDLETTLADHIEAKLRRRPRQGDVVPVGAIALVAHRVTDGVVTSVGLRLAEDDETALPPATMPDRCRAALRRAWTRIRQA
jgi:cell volume regulation protein A